MPAPCRVVRPGLGLAPRGSQSPPHHRLSPCVLLGPPVARPPVVTCRGGGCSRGLRLLGGARGAPCAPRPRRACGQSASPGLVCMAFPARPRVTAPPGRRLCCSLRAAGGRPQPREWREPTNEVSEPGVTALRLPPPRQNRVARGARAAKSNGPETCWGPALAVSACQRPQSSPDSIKFPRIIGAPGSHNSSHSRFNLAASNSYLWR